MRVVRFDTSSGSPDTREWHDWRAQGIGGSDAIHIAAKAGMIVDPPSWVNGKKLLAQKLGVAKPTKSNWVMERGSRLEEPARKRFEEESVEFLDEELRANAFQRFKQKTGLVMRPGFGEMDSHPFIRASFDGLDFWGRILEIKCPSQAIHNQAKGKEVASYYLPQLAHQLMVRHGEPKLWTGKEEVYFVSYNPDDENGEDLAIVKLQSHQLKGYAQRLLTVHANWYNKWQSLAKLNLPQRLHRFEQKHERLFATFSEAKAIEESAKECIKDKVENASYVPAFHNAKPGSRNNPRLNEEAILQRLSWDRVPDRYKKPSSMVLRVNKPEVSYENPLEAEKDMIKAKNIIKTLKPEFEKAKEEAEVLADQIGYLQGDCFSMYEKVGGIDWNLVCSDHGLSKEEFTEHTKSHFVTIRAKTQKQLEQEAAKAKATAA